MVGIFLFAAAVFFRGIQWGLPTTAVNRTLFGTHPIWTGQQIIDLAGGWDTSAPVGADIDRNPLQGRDKVILLNATNAQRAEIVRRYRLFSYQPDEMITMRALSQMNPAAGRLDPKLYQYGGLWIYPVGGLLKIASLKWFGFVQLSGDLAFYLDHPEAFGRFYVVARAYSAAWGIVGAIAVWWMVRQLIPCRGVAFLAGIAFAAMPVVVCMSHEAKPHLAGAVLMLLATLAAMRYVDLGRARDAVLAGVLCGAAFGMILSSLPIFIILPLMTLMRPDEWPRRTRMAAIGLAIGGAVYVVTNPYVPINFLFHRELFASNVGNYGNFYSVKDVPAGVWNAIRLALEGAGGAFVIAGVIGWLALHFSPPMMRKKLILLAVPAICMFVQFALLAAGKPGEYGRFLLFPDVVLMIGAMIALSKVRTAGVRLAVAGVLTMVTALSGAAYLRGFVADAYLFGTRVELKHFLAEQDPAAIAVFAEPAPYSLPPVNLFRTKILLAPKGSTASLSEADFTVFPVDRVPAADLGGSSILHYTTPISWADKPFVVRRKANPGGGNLP